MQECTSFAIIADYMPPKVRAAMSLINMADCQSASEIRLYSGRAVAVIFPDRVMYLTTHGLTASRKNLAAVMVSAEELSAVVDSLSHYSIHSCQRELRQGFFVLKGGIRVGLSGVYSADGIITQYTGLNFRISRNVPDCAKTIADLDGGILICGGVNSGKTTILRDLCRLIGNRRKTALIDERNEIAFTRDGEVMNDVGAMTDVLTGCSRSEGIVAAVRTLSPEYIFCDEISTSDDSRAITESLGCGVKFCATIHAENYSGLMRRPVASDLIELGAFSHAVIMKGAHAPGEISEIRRLGDDA